MRSTEIEHENTMHQQNNTTVENNPNKKSVKSLNPTKSVIPTVRKGYKQTEVGMIPVDWEVKEIQEFATIRTGDSDTQDRLDEGEYPFFVRSQTIERINSYSFDGEAILTSGDGVGVGKIYHYVNEKFDYHQRVYNVHNFQNDVSGKYFFYYFSTNFNDRVMSMTAKSSVDSVRREMISEMKIPLPPLPEQQAIAEVLSDTDAYLTQLEQLIAKKKAIKQGAMQELLKPKEGWEVKKLGEVGELITGGTPTTSISKYWKGNIPWITPTDISNNLKDISTSERSITKEGLSVIRKLPENSLLVTCIASIGKNAILRKAGACNQQINAIIPNVNHVVDFLYYLIESNKSHLISKAGITATLMVSKKVFSRTSQNRHHLIRYGFRNRTIRK